MRRWIPLVALTALLMALDVVAEERAQADLEKLQGSWTLVSAERDGKALSPQEVKQTKITFKGDAFAFPEAAGIGTSKTGAIQIDPTKSPKWMDSKATNDADKGAVMLGIYELSGDDYRVCFSPPGKERPKEFASKPGSGNILQVWKRATK